MTNLHRYTSFEDLKNSGISDQVTPADAAKAALRQKKWLDVLKSASATMVPARRKRKQHGK